MRTQSNPARRSYRPAAADDYFERKGRELVVAEEEIEAWELDAQDLSDLGERDDLDASGSY